MRTEKRSSGRLIGIVGPTASGKTGLSLRLARELQADILCVDSRTVYRYMDIGTAKPTSVERQDIQHLGLDLIEPNQDYTVYDFVCYARPIIEDYLERKQPLILVGGSGLYFDALLFGYQFRETNMTKESFEQYSSDQLVEQARALYPDEISQIDVKNRRRVEQLLLRGPSKTDDRETIKIPINVYGIMLEKPYLKENIYTRTQDMLNQGFVQEVIQLKDAYGAGCPQLSTTGYAAVMKHLNGELPIAELAQQINVDTYALAKKQITWFKRNPFITWYSNLDRAYEEAIADVRD